MRFISGLFCDFGFGTGVGLEEFRTYLASPSVLQVKPAHIRGLIDNNPKRLWIEDQTAYALEFFMNCERDPRGFWQDPLFIDRCVLDLEDSTRYVAPAEWPGLYEILEKLRRLAAATKPIRLACLLHREPTAEGVLS